MKTLADTVGLRRLRLGLCMIDIVDGKIELVTGKNPYFSIDHGCQ